MLVVPLFVVVVGDRRFLVVFVVVLFVGCRFVVP